LPSGETDAKDGPMVRQFLDQGAAASNRHPHLPPPGPFSSRDGSPGYRM